MFMLSVFYIGMSLLKKMLIKEYGVRKFYLNETWLMQFFSDHPVKARRLSKIC